MSSFRVLILGGGFTGLTVARRLAKASSVRTTLVSESSHALFTPRLVDALAQTCSEQLMHVPHRTIAERAGYAFLEARILHVDTASRTVFLETASGTTTESYDTLVCALGAETAFFELKGTEHMFPLKTWEHLLAVEERLRLVIQKPHPRLAVVGGGPVGVETAVALHMRLVRLGVPQDKRTITIYQAGPQLLQGFLPKTVEKSAAFLAARGIDVVCGSPVKEAHAHSLVLQDGRTEPSDLTIWASGVKARSIPFEGHPPHEQAGALVPDHHLRLLPHVFAGGDVITYKTRQMVVPKNAQTAVNMGKLIATNVLREAAKEPLLSFTYHSPGVLLWLGRTAIADLYGRSLASPLFAIARSLLYRLRWWELTR